MGTYDTFVVPKLGCPQCGDVHEWGFQTKLLGEGMDYIRWGENLKATRFGWIQDARVKCLDYCKKCGWWIDGIAVIHDWVFERVEVTPREDSGFDPDTGIFGAQKVEPDA